MPANRLVPELVTLALPPPMVCEAKPLAVPGLVVVAFCVAPVALLVKGAGAVPEFVQVRSVAVVVQINCAEAGELAESASVASAAAQHKGVVDAKRAAA